MTRLTNDDLKDIGVSALGDRLTLLDATAALAGEKPPADVPTSQSKPALPKGPAVSAERRPITVIFCDLVGSTSLAAELDAEDWRDLVNAYLDEASRAVTGVGGHVLKRLGDGLMALFGYPMAQENDAERAVRAALAIQQALGELNARNSVKNAPQLSARIGIDSGRVVVEASGEVFGDAPNIAARVQAVAEPGSVLVTMNVQRQVAGLFVADEQGAQELKGVPEPVQLFSIVRASGGGRRGGARTLTPFVGREEELGVLARRWERARGGEGQLVLIVGEPGLGKSRLIEEFRSRLTETPHTWVEWSASQLLQNTPLHPIAEWGRQRFGVDAPAEQRLADLEKTLRLIGLDPSEHAPLIAPLVDIPLPPERAASFPPEELRRRQLAAMTALVLAGARSQPVVIAFEDLHWADPTSLDLLRALAERGAQAPLLLLATTRPEFRQPWSLRSHHSLIALSPLDRAGVARMVGEISASHALSKEMIDGVSERTGGVPLFVEEVTRLLLERGERGGVHAIPPTLQQSLAARLDRLGPAREIAQIGAVLGRDFAYPLLREVAATDETVLRASLERLAEADLIFVEGAPPQANYRFKHALIQDAAYDSLLKSRRQALHCRAAELLRGDPERAAAEPEVIAHHFTETGLDDLAIEWWGKAGDQALRRSAFQEAIAHLGKAIAMADKAGRAIASERAAFPSNQRIKLQTDYGRALMWSKGYAAEETSAAFARVGELASQTGNSVARSVARNAQFVRSLVRGEMDTARDTAESFVRETEAGRPMEAALARRLLGATCLFQGEPALARSHLEQALAGYKPEWDMDVRQLFGADTRIISTSYLAMSTWVLGDIEYARQLIEQAVREAIASNDVITIAQVYFFETWFEAVREHPAASRRAGERTREFCGEHGIVFFGAGSQILSAWARGRLLDAAAGAKDLRDALALYVEQGNKLWTPWFHGLIAELEAITGRNDAAFESVDAGIALAQETGERWSDPLLLHRKGEILLERDAGNPAPTEEAFQAAIAVAKQQATRSFELRAALSLAKLHQSTGRLVEAHAVLDPALEGFSPTPEMPEIAEAQALLAALGETSEVRAAIGQRRRVSRLQVAYGNALIAARSFGAPETTEAFARARESASGDKDTSDRLAADYGLWLGSYVRGEFSSMRAHARTFLNDVGARLDSPEAGIAYRISGVTHQFAGEFVEARDEIEHALSLFEPGRDDDLAFRFGLDPGVTGHVCLAIASWPLGDIDRAISHIERAHERLAGVTHVGTLAFARHHAAMFELMRCDRARVEQNAIELARLAREYHLTMFRAFAVFLQGWVNAEGTTAGTGLEDMRGGVALLREQNVLFFDGLLKAALAEVEAQAGDPDRGLALVDEALTAATGTGYHAFEAELYRTRGDILLKRDPSNPAPSEEAFQTSLAIAKEQSARSWGLRAALALAKLYQSTGRPNDAYAVLAPALEGFSPTPEMPEIAEAMSLSARLA